MSRFDTSRLVLRDLVPGDAPFLLELLTDPTFIEHIGDRGVRTEEEARVFLENRILPSYDAHGFGLYRVGLREGDVPAGLCGFVKRDFLDDPDLGFAFLPGFRGRGFAREAAEATLDHGWRDLGLSRIVAIVSPGNEPSRRLLAALGMRFERMVRMPGEETDIELHTMDRPA